MTQNQNSMPELDGSGDVDPNGRVPDFDHGMNDVVIQSCRYRATPGFNLLGLVGDKVRGCFVSLKKNPLYAINYGTRDLKRLIAASKGFAQDSDAAKAITEQEIREFLGPTQPGAGRRIRVEARQGKPNPKKPGQFYTEVQFYPSPDRSLGPVVASDEAPAPKTAAPPVPPPAPSGASDGGPWFDLPANDPRRPGVTQYNAKHELR
jgi:hypothetical protein